ncbi:MAG: FecR domain-containing protein [Bdellovibrionales bacterium]|nr:FecR domain-containing protein [Bdellovibrionales bacterium]
MAKFPIKILCLVFFAIHLLLGAESRAAQVHGILTVVKGNVSIKSGKTGKDEKAKIGMKVFPKDSILTQADSRAKIVMVDKNEINVSPSSNIVIDSYEFDPAKDNKKVLIDVIYGKVRAKVEQKYDGENNKFQVKTPSAVAGVRGTDFFTSFNQVTNSSKVVTFKGEVAFGLPGPGGTILNPVSVRVGEFTANTGNNPPAPAVPMPKAELAQFDKETKADAPDREKQAGPGGGSNQPEKDKKDQQKKDEGGNKGQGSDQKKDEGGNKSPDSDQKKDQGGNKGQGNNKEGRGNDGPRNEQGEKGSEQSKNEPGSNPKNGTGAARGPDARPDGTSGPSGPGSGPGSGPEFAGGPPTPGMGGDPKRDPSGMMPMPMEGTGMMRPEDFASAPNMPAFVGMMPPPPMMPFMPPPMPGSNIICEFCREVIQDGATRLFIRVTQGSQ